MSNRKYPRLSDGLVGLQFADLVMSLSAMFFVNKLFHCYREIAPRLLHNKVVVAWDVFLTILFLLYLSRYHEGSPYHPYQVNTSDWQRTNLVKFCHIHVNYMLLNLNETLLIE